MLEFGVRSTGDPLLDRSTNFVSSNTKPAKRCDKIGATPSVVRRVPMRRRSRAQQYPDLVSFLKGCGYNNRESEELQSRRNPGRTDCCRVSTNMRRAGWIRLTHSSIQEPGCGSTPRCRGGRVSDGATQASKATLRSVWRICISIRLIKASQLHLIGLPQEVVEQSGGTISAVRCGRRRTPLLGRVR
ncbi:hypothetical protein M2171_008421 [Bradyrhizobium japonicum USDA 38]|nr:hypothetical protein [Bradyrhizobium japonicum USDA 38]MCS3942342.1 hypothetical protein [Bradyrhizobium japonicum]